MKKIMLILCLLVCCISCKEKSKIQIVEEHILELIDQEQYNAAALLSFYQAAVIQGNEDKLLDEIQKFVKIENKPQLNTY
jgi:hypothetical protein